MNVSVLKSFEKDISKIKDAKIAIQILDVIQNLETCNSLIEINNIKKLKAKGDYYRIRIGNYRLGLKLENNSLSIIRCLYRKDIYKYFP